MAALTPSPDSPHVLLGEPQVDPAAPLSQREPARIVGYVTAFAAAGLTLAVAFGLKLTPEQTVAITAVIGVLANIVQAEVTRGKVYAPATVDQLAAPEPQPRRALTE
jgi:hypothetical protein